MPEIRIGVSGWSFDEWKNTFYEGVPRRLWLSHYASIYDTVEVNYTFRRTMSESTAAKWVETVGEDFRFSVKAHQRITHHGRIKNPEETLPHFFNGIAGLSSRQGPVLFQLPPHLKSDTGRLKNFLSQIPEGTSSVFEFRHESWMTDETYDVLAGNNAGLVLAETDENTVPDVFTSDVVYLRLRKTEYTLAELEEWAKRLSDLGERSVWVYMKHEDNSPKYASQLIEVLKG
jgi:uncharacterized protein YecE (DUF72 family)